MKNYKLILVFFNSLNKCTNAHYILNKRTGCSRQSIDPALSLAPCVRARVRVEVKRGVC